MAIAIEVAFVPRLAKKARLKLDRHANKYMIIYPERGLELNDAAAQIAQKCDGSRSIAAITDELAKEHDGAPRAVIEADVLAFVTMLRDKGLLELE
ncbi:MAG: putative Coenzyme synthesis protein [Myxococcaceae bacterium]|jgi:coenzyme PQQ biosynthesis protein PqqD|nr:putative Coenzyme synthesis protein [Myxococcaceae bacterium]MEA2751248.1 pyrroloquinoline quinone biosynthesis protein [Myxococcales bacterium]